MKNLAREVRYALRITRRSPMFAVVTVLTLALGISANSTVFGWINSTLLNPVPGISDTDGLLTLTLTQDGETHNDFSYLDYLDLRHDNMSFAGLAAHRLRPLQLTGGETPRRVWGTLVSRVASVGTRSVRADRSRQSSTSLSDHS